MISVAMPVQPNTQGSNVKGIKNKDNTIQAGLLEEMSPLLPLEKIENIMIKVHERSKTVSR